MSKSNRVTTVELTDTEIEYLSKLPFWDYMKVKVDLDFAELMKYDNYDKYNREMNFYDTLYEKLTGKKIIDK